MNIWKNLPLLPERMNAEKSVHLTWFTSREFECLIFGVSLLKFGSLQGTATPSSNKNVSDSLFEPPGKISALSLPGAFWIVRLQFVRFGIQTLYVGPSFAGLIFEILADLLTKCGT